MVAVIEFAGVTVRRGSALLLDEVSWEVEEDERWVVLGPNGAGKTTLLQVAAAQLHPTSGVAGILDEVLGTTDVFELRPRIGLTSAALADRIPRDELVKTRRWHKPCSSSRRMFTSTAKSLLLMVASSTSLPDDKRLRTCMING